MYVSNLKIDMLVQLFWKDISSWSFNIRTKILQSEFELKTLHTERIDHFRYAMRSGYRVRFRYVLCEVISSVDCYSRARDNRAKMYNTSTHSSQRSSRLAERREATVRGSSRRSESKLWKIPEWVHCEKCFATCLTKEDLVLLSCGHIFCGECLRIGTSKFWHSIALNCNIF